MSFSYLLEIPSHLKLMKIVISVLAGNSIASEIDENCSFVLVGASTASEIVENCNFVLAGTSTASEIVETCNFVLVGAQLYLCNMCDAIYFENVTYVKKS